MSLTARKITPIQIVDDMDAAAEAFAALGFQPASTDAACPCAGWRADNGSSVVVMARTLVAQEFGEEIAGKIANRALSYVFVDCVPDALEDLGDNAKIIAQTVTSYGTMEAIVETAGGPMILAERLED
ncbi:MAG: hypothetical protein KDJ18_14425 [Hyphomicrobiaceae bacterium]|nr:hypothetical protein [Hyphomicrobiaceae bacterium]